MRLGEPWRWPQPPFRTPPSLLLLTSRYHRRAASLSGREGLESVSLYYGGSRAWEPCLFSVVSPTPEAINPQAYDL